MLKPLELSLFPSCFEALAWSSEGELAIASGEYVQVLTPKQANQIDPDQDGKGAWNSIRIRVNVFTNSEWATIYPQNRDDFSLGVEQSLSHVIGVSWSPPGLARFRRCLLAVLTANLILSLWEPVGENGQWIRVGIVNHALHPEPGTLRALHGEEIRRFSLRSFHWCSPLRVLSPTAASHSASDPESRWGVHLLVVANDNNELIVFRIRRFPKSQASPIPYCIEKLAMHPVTAEGNLFPQIDSNTLLHRTLQAKSRILSVSCGPWTESPSPPEQVTRYATAMIAATHGTCLRVFRVSVALNDSYPEENVTPRYEAIAKFTDLILGTLKHVFDRHCVTGPLQWLHATEDFGRGTGFPATDNVQKDPEFVPLAIGITGGVLTLPIPFSIYSASNTDTTATEFQDWSCPVWPTKDTEEAETHGAPISAFAVSTDSRRTSAFHVGTLDGRCGSASLDASGKIGAWQEPPWAKVVENLREQYDLDLDLGGEIVIRIWGLASWRGLSAVLFTRHPTDMIEYRITSGERAMVAFGSADTDSQVDLHSQLSPATGEKIPASERRERVISFLLSGDITSNTTNSDDQRLVYAAACCAIVDTKNDSIRSQARRALELLATLTGADLNDEISKCSLESSEMVPNPSRAPDGPGGHMFEWCEVCDSSIGWSSPDEAKCAEGHVFARCGLSFLAIQEPGVSKYCPSCRREFFDEDSLTSRRDGRLGRLFLTLFETYDSCLFCDSKFQST